MGPASRPTPGPDTPVPGIPDSGIPGLGIPGRSVSGSDTAGSDTAGSDTAGSDTPGSDTRPTQGSGGRRPTYADVALVLGFGGVDFRSDPRSSSSRWKSAGSWKSL
jgi:hypothetical protein